MDKEQRVFWIVQMALAIAGAAALIGAYASDADAHEAVSGWSYPMQCCSGYDCRPIGGSESDKAERVYETALGYRFLTSDEVIPYGDPRVKVSPDGEYHWCTVQGKSDGKTICLFVPPMGS